MTLDSETLSAEELEHVINLIRDGQKLMDGDLDRIEAAARRGVSAGEIEEQTLNKFWHYLVGLQSSLGTGAASVLFCYARDLGHKVGQEILGAGGAPLTGLSKSTNPVSPETGGSPTAPTTGTLSGGEEDRLRAILDNTALAMGFDPSEGHWHTPLPAQPGGEEHSPFCAMKYHYDRPCTCHVRRKPFTKVENHPDTGDSALVERLHRYADESKNDDPWISHLLGGCREAAAAIERLSCRPTWEEFAEVQAKSGVATLRNATYWGDRCCKAEKELAEAQSTIASQAAEIAKLLEALGEADKVIAWLEREYAITFTLYDGRKVAEWCEKYRSALTGRE
jgi:hypothetical protein